MSDVQVIPAYLVFPWFKKPVNSPGLKRRNRNKVSQRRRRLTALSNLQHQLIAVSAEEKFTARFRRIKEEIAVLEKRLVA